MVHHRGAMILESEVPFLQRWRYIGMVNGEQANGSCLGYAGPYQIREYTDPTHCLSLGDSEIIAEFDDIVEAWNAKERIRVTGRLVFLTLWIRQCDVELLPANTPSYRYAIQPSEEELAELVEEKKVPENT